MTIEVSMPKRVATPEPVQRSSALSGRYDRKTGKLSVTIETEKPAFILELIKLIEQTGCGPVLGWPADLPVSAPDEVLWPFTPRELISSQDFGDDDEGTGGMLRVEFEVSGRAAKTIREWMAANGKPL
jgi:hypothetical protein